MRKPGTLIGYIWVGKSSLEYNGHYIKESLSDWNKTTNNNNKTPISELSNNVRRKHIFGSQSKLTSVSQYLTIEEEFAYYTSRNNLRNAFEIGYTILIAYVRFAYHIHRQKRLRTTQVD